MKFNLRDLQKILTHFCKKLLKTWSHTGTVRGVQSFWKLVVTFFTPYYVPGASISCYGRPRVDGKFFLIHSHTLVVRSKKNGQSKQYKRSRKTREKASILFKCLFVYFLSNSQKAWKCPKPFWIEKGQNVLKRTIFCISSNIIRNSFLTHPISFVKMQ